MRSNNSLTLSFLLAFNTLLLIKSADSKIYTRLNEVEMEARLIDALTSGDDQDQEITIREKNKSISQIITELNELRKQYQATLEPTHEYGQFTLSDRSEFETEIFDRLTELFIFIKQKNLILEKTYGEVMAQSWTGQAL